MIPVSETERRITLERCGGFREIEMECDNNEAAGG